MMVLFVCIAIPRQTKNVVRPSYDGQSMMGEDSVAKRRSDCQEATEMNYPSNISYCSRRRSYANKFAPEP